MSDAEVEPPQPPAIMRVDTCEIIYPRASTAASSMSGAEVEPPRPPAIMRADICENIYPRALMTASSTSGAEVEPPQLPASNNNRQVIYARAGDGKSCVRRRKLS